MKAFLTLALLLVVGIAATSAAGPRLEIPKIQFDFGYVPQHAKVTHAFWLKSAGDDTLKILRVIPGCGCTQAPLERDILAPKDSTTVEIIFSTGGYTGAVIKQPRIRSNEGDAEKTIQINAHVLTRPDSTYPVVLRPYKLDLTQSGDKARTEAKFTIVNMSDSRLKPTLVYSPKGFFEVTLPASVPPGGSAEGVLKLKKLGDGVELEKSFTIQFDDEQKSRFTIPVKRGARIGAQQAAGSQPSTAGAASGGH